MTDKFRCRTQEQANTCKYATPRVRERVLDSGGFLAPKDFIVHPPAPTEARTKIASTGGSSSYYFLPKGATELNDLIEFKEMSFARGNIFKALYRLGEKEGIDIEYDLNKIELFLGRLREMVKKGQSI